MIKYKYGALAGLYNIIGFTLLMPCIDNLSDILIITSMAVITLGGAIFLSASARDTVHKNMRIAALVSFFGWLALFFGIGHLFSPLFDSVGGPAVGQYLYFASGFFLVLFLFFGYVIALIIHKFRYRKRYKHGL